MNAEGKTPFEGLLLDQRAAGWPREACRRLTACSEGARPANGEKRTRITRICGHPVISMEPPQDMEHVTRCGSFEGAGA